MQEKYFHNILYLILKMLTGRLGDLSACDSYYGYNFKEKLYVPRPQTIQELKINIWYLII